MLKLPQFRQSKLIHYNYTTIDLYLENEGERGKKIVIATLVRDRLALDELIID